MVHYPHPHPGLAHHYPQTRLPPADRSYADRSERSSAPDDIVLLVGKHRRPYRVNTQSLIRGSAYFRNLLDLASPAAVWPSLALDCEESIFENLLLLMRYGTYEALPPMSAAGMSQLKKEASFYGIDYTEARCAHPPQAMSNDSSSSEVSCSSSPQSTFSSSPKSAIFISTPHTPRPRSESRLYHERLLVTCGMPQQGLSELPEFPSELVDPGQMVLTTCVDVEKARVYTCDCQGRSDGTTQWALNFHHRHAFCTACGEAPRVSGKRFAEMFMAAAAFYTAKPGERDAEWRIGCDSTCLLRFVRSSGNAADMCGCATPGIPTVWAASAYYSHAFCTSCSKEAEGQVLLSVLLALRYGGGGSKASKSARFSSTALTPSGIAHR